MILRHNTGPENDLTSIVVSELAASGLLDSERGERRCTMQEQCSKSPQ